MVGISKVKQQKAATRASQSNRQRWRSNATKETEHRSRIRTPPPYPPPHPRTELKHKCKSKLACAKVESRQKHRKIGHKPHSHGRHHRPHPPPPHPRTELKDKCKSKLACAESRESAKILQNTDAKCDTHRKTPKRKDAKCRAQHVFAQCSPPAGALFCCKTPQTPMRKQKQSSIPGEQSAKTRVSAHASRGIAPPRAAADAHAANSKTTTTATATMTSNNNHNQHRSYEISTCRTTNQQP